MMKMFTQILVVVGLTASVQAMEQKKEVKTVDEIEQNIVEQACLQEYHAWCDQYARDFLWQHQREITLCKKRVICELRKLGNTNTRGCRTGYPAIDFIIAQANKVRNMEARAVQRSHRYIDSQPYLSVPEQAFESVWSALLNGFLSSSEHYTLVWDPVGNSYKYQTALPYYDMAALGVLAFTRHVGGRMLYELEQSENCEKT